MTLADCYLRQGAGGTKTAHFGSRIWFLSYFYNRSEAYFGQKSVEHVKTIKRKHVDTKNNDFSKRNVLRKLCFLRVLMCSSNFWSKYASERLWYYLRKQVLEPKRAVLVPPAPCLKLQSVSMRFIMWRRSQIMWHCTVLWPSKISHRWKTNKFQ